MEYLVVIEQAVAGSFSAYVPDLPGCVSRGDSLEEARTMIQEAIRLHIEPLQSHRDPVPRPAAIAHLVTV